MAHRDTDSEREYFTADNGETSGLYTADRSPDTGGAGVTVSATVSIRARPTDWFSVIVDRVERSEGGSVTVLS